MTTGSIYYHIFGSLSAAASAIVVITGLIFPSQMLETRRIFPHTIFFISFCDMFAALSISFGWARQYSNEVCVMQGFLTAFFIPASWIWMVLLVFQLRCAMVLGRVWLKAPQMHMLVWSLSSVTAFVPLSTTRYGNDDDVTGPISLCYLRGSTSSVQFWGAFVFFGVLILCFSIMLLCLFEVAHRLHAGSLPNTDNALRLLKSTFLYPLAMFVVWFPLSVCLMLVAVGHHERYGTYLTVAQTLSSQNGTATCLIFISQSSSARNMMLRALGVRCTSRARARDWSDHNDLQESFVLSIISANEDVTAAARDDAGGDEFETRWDPAPAPAPVVPITCDPEPKISFIVPGPDQEGGVSSTALVAEGMRPSEVIRPSDS